MGVFGPKMKDVTGGWKLLYNKKPHSSYASVNIIYMVE
jgi:hypothetical protein